MVNNGHAGRGHPKVTDTQLIEALRAIEHDGVSQRQMAKELGISPASLSSRLKKMRPKREATQTNVTLLKQVKDLKKRIELLELIFERYKLVPLLRYKDEKR